MLYNPIFEEEQEKKSEFKTLRKEIKYRLFKRSLRNMISRVYNIFQKKEMLISNKA